MGRLRKKSRILLEDALKSSKFTRHAFTINDNLDSSTPFEIVFDHNPDFRFRCQGSEGSWHIRYSPGNIMFTDETNVGGAYSNVVNAVKDWVVRVDEDTDLLDTWSPHVLAIKEQLEKYIAENPDAMASRFTAEEAQNLLAHLKQIEVSYQALLEQKAISEEELKNALEKIRSLESELSYVTRGTWYRSFIHRYLDVTEGFLNSGEVRELAMEAWKTAVREGVKSVLHLPSGSTQQLTLPQSLG